LKDDAKERGLDKGNRYQEGRDKTGPLSVSGARVRNAPARVVYDRGIGNCAPDVLWK
jgi:hypothetical protein